MVAAERPVSRHPPAHHFECGFQEVVGGEDNVSRVLRATPREDGEQRGFLCREEEEIKCKWVKDYCITGRANVISCAVGLR